jgi:ABC-type transport system involved in multi-copper enzyme maturation permease subunit
MTQRELTAPSTMAQTLTPTNNWLLETLRLARWMLYTVRRRAMGKVVFGILIGSLLLVNIVQLLIYNVTANSTPGGESCVGSPEGGPPVCRPFTPEQAHAMQQQAMKDIAMGLTFPQTLTVVEVLVGLLGVIVLTTLAGAIAGGEYGYGTIRVALSRGAGRAQWIVAQALALAALSLVAAAVLMVLGMLVGFTLGPALGGTLPAFQSGVPGELLLTWLVLALTLFGYCVIALFFATLGRSTAAGIGFALGFFVAEALLQGILTAVGFAFQLSQPDLSKFITHIPDWFLGPNVGYILQQVSRTPLAINANSEQTNFPFAMGHAVLVTVLYLALAIGGSYLLLRRRDITD